MKDFIQNHKKLVIIIGIVIVFIVVCLVIRSINLSNKTNQPLDDFPVDDSVVQQNPDSEEKDSNYDSNLGLGTGKDDGRVEVTEEEETEEETEVLQTIPTYNTTVKIWGNTSVPKRTMDGRSFTGYLNSVKLNDFGTFWGNALTYEDLVGGKLYYIGVEQQVDEVAIADLQSVGWLKNNLSSMKPNDAIKFTNLHVIGSLSSNHVALLCCYDWYSAFGLKDTLVVFEDISGTLNTSDFKDGDIFSTTVFVHNIKVVENVKGYDVVVVQYNVFKQGVVR